MHSLCVLFTVLMIDSIDIVELQFKFTVLMIDSIDIVESQFKFE